MTAYKVKLLGSKKQVLNTIVVRAENELEAAHAATRSREFYEGMIVGRITEQLYKVCKVMKASANRYTLRRNLTETQAQDLTNAYPSTPRHSVHYFKQ